MKRFLLSAAMLLAMHFGALATVITNTTACPITVKQTCYDATCKVISTTSYTILAFGTLTTGTLCPPGSVAVYEVCWGLVVCNRICASVEGSQWPGCGPGVYTNTLAPCPSCAPTGGTVRYDALRDTLDIFP